MGTGMMDGMGRTQEPKQASHTFFFFTCTKQRLEQTVETGDAGALTRYREKPKCGQLLIATNGRI